LESCAGIHSHAQTHPIGDEGKAVGDATPPGGFAFFSINLLPQSSLASRLNRHSLAADRITRFLFFFRRLSPFPFAGLSVVAGDAALDHFASLKATLRIAVIAPHIYMAGKMTTTPPKYQPPPNRTYTNIGWICAALIGPATFLAVWIYCAVTYGVLLGFSLGWIPALILALLVTVATNFLWPVTTVVLLYVISRAFVIHQQSLIYIALFVGVIAIATIWWWHVVRDNEPP
jgi:hypothetical protein